MKKTLKDYLKRVDCRENRQGFTLIELMVVITVFLIIISSIFAVLVGGKRAWFISEAQIDINNDARRAIQRMTQELSQTAPSRFTITNISANEDRIIFQTASSYAARVVVWGDQIQYSLGGVDGAQILRTDLNTAAVEVLASHVTRLLFTSTGTDLLNMTVQITRQSLKGDNQQLQLTSQVAVRNR